MIIKINPHGNFVFILFFNKIKYSKPDLINPFEK